MGVLVETLRGEVSLLDTARYRPGRSYDRFGSLCYGVLWVRGFKRSGNSVGTRCELIGCEGYAV